VKALLIVAFGGALGSVARFKISSWILHHAASWRFPIATLVVNVAGCLAAGLLAGLSVKHHMFTPETRLLLFTGVLGGFTTFSAFGLETVLLMKRGEWFIAAANVTLSVVVGLCALWWGMALAKSGA
jgi:CrcB protein